MDICYVVHVHINEEGISLTNIIAGILEQASNLPYECASICSFCSRMKRGRIYACARREGYNVLALGQHLDDLCERFEFVLLCLKSLENV